MGDAVAAIGPLSQRTSIVREPAKAVTMLRESLRRLSDHDVPEQAVDTHQHYNTNLFVGEKRVLP